MTNKFTEKIQNKFKQIGFMCLKKPSGRVSIQLRCVATTGPCIGVNITVYDSQEVKIIIDEGPIRWIFPKDFGPPPAGTLIVNDNVLDISEFRISSNEDEAVNVIQENVVQKVHQIVSRRQDEAYWQEDL
jgi:hypothetical protein